MRFVFRADASLAIGSGHVMRCLTLADELSARGHSCVFVSRDLDGNLHGLVQARGYPLENLHGRGPSYAPGEVAPFHAPWLEAPWQDDARATRAIVETVGGDCVVVDHYGLDARWQDIVRTSVRRMIVWDDLADRPHHADVLIDQNLGRSTADYIPWLPSTCHVLAGAQYAILQPRYAQLRQASLTRRTHGRIEHVLVSMGGVDPDNATGALLPYLNRAHLPDLERVTLVVGRHAPWLATLRVAAAQATVPTEIAVAVTDLAERMASADLAFGGAGGTAWERCCLGVPSVVVILAPNQRAGAQALARAGAAWVVPSVATIPHEVPALLQRLRAADTVCELSHHAAQVTDGLGARRVCDSLESHL